MACYGNDPPLTPLTLLRALPAVLLALAAGLYYAQYRRRGVEAFPEQSAPGGKRGRCLSAGHVAGVSYLPDRWPSAGE